MQHNIDFADNPYVFYVEAVGGHRGMHYYDFELCPALQSVGVNVTVLTCDETENVAIPSSLNVEFPFQGIFGETSKIIRGLRYLRGLLKTYLAMQRRDIPLAHFHYFHFLPLDYLYHKWLHFMGKRLVVTAHDVVPFDTKVSDMIWLRRIYHEADRIIVHAENNRDVMLEKFDVDPGKVVIVPMGPYINFAQEQTMPEEVAKQRLGIELDAQVVLFFGQIKKVKGLQILIRAFRQVLDQCPTARLVIAGPEWKESFESYAALIQELELTNQVVTRIEYVPDAEVGIYYSAASVVALPYTAAYQSAVLYMAYSFSKPVVASTVGGLTEIVQDSITGLLVPPNDASALADALLTLLWDEKTARSMGERGHTLVKEKFGWFEIAQKVSDVYAQAFHSS